MSCSLSFMRTLALPEAMEQCSLITLRKKLFKIRSKVVCHGRYIIIQMAEVAIRQIYLPTSCVASTGSDRSHSQHD